MITIAIDQQGPLMVGARISGNIYWVQESADAKVRRLKLFVRWYTEGRGDKDTNAIWQQEVPVVSIQPGSQMQFPFDTGIPTEGPVTYNGKLLRVLWEVAVEFDLPMQSDPVYRQPFIVVPRWAAP